MADTPVHDSQDSGEAHRVVSLTYHLTVNEDGIHQHYKRVGSLGTASAWLISYYDSQGKHWCKITNPHRIEKLEQLLEDRVRQEIV